MKTFAKIATLAVVIAAGPAAHAMEDAAASAPAAAAAPPASIKAGVNLSTAEGTRLGRIERVVTGADGKAERVSVIYDSRFVYIPASTLSAAEKGYVTSLTKADVRKLK